MASAQDLKPRKYALLIGIDKYLGGGIQGVAPLTFAVKDAETLEEALEDRDWQARAVVKEEATRRRIVRELWDLAINAKPRDKVLVYFAGHGVNDPLGNGNTYWLTYNASLASLAADGIRLKHILEYVRDIPALEKIVVLDHCYSGDITRTPEATADPGPDAGEESRAFEGEARLVPARALFPTDLEGIQEQSEDRMVVLGAARGPAYEHEDWGHGMFTKAILDVLNDPDADTSDPKDGKLSLGEFWTQVKKRVQEMAASKGLEQKPLGSDIQLDQIDWILFDASVDAGSEAHELKTVLTSLDLVATLDFEVKMACLNLLTDWEQKEKLGLAQEPRHERVVGELRNIRDSGTSSQAEQKKLSLEALVRGLGLVQ